MRRMDGPQDRSIGDISVTAPTCPNCKRPALLSNARFCGKCGAYLLIELSNSKFLTKLWHVSRAILVLCGAAAVCGAIVLIAMERENKFGVPRESHQLSSSNEDSSDKKAITLSSGTIVNQANTIEIPGADRGFNGTWGGYSKGTIYSPSGISVQTTGTEPQGTTFEDRDGKIVIKFHIRGDPDSNVVGSPKAWALSPFEVVLRVETATFQYHWVGISRYKLIGPDRVFFTTNNNLYDAHSGQLLEWRVDKATFKKLEREEAERWDRARTTWETQHQTVNLGNFEAPAADQSQ